MNNKEMPEKLTGAEEPDKGRMGLEEAHKEANMMRSRLDVDPRLGKRFNTRSGPQYSPERISVPSVEYEKASQEIDELIKRAESEPKSEKLWFEVARFLRKLKHDIGLNVPLDEKFMTRGNIKSHIFFNKWPPEVLMKGLKDAAFELKLLQGKGAEFGEKEKKVRG